MPKNPSHPSADGYRSYQLVGARYGPLALKPIAECLKPLTAHIAKSHCMRHPPINISKPDSLVEFAHRDQAAFGSDAGTFEIELEGTV